MIEAQQHDLLYPKVIDQSVKSRVRKDFTEDGWSIALLLVLYALQGIPMGLCGSIPLILKEKGISYEGLSLFSLVSLPFSLKLLWAPLVDSCYIPSVGRRKSWLIPGNFKLMIDIALEYSLIFFFLGSVAVQLLNGLVMIVGSVFVSNWIGDNPTNHINVSALTLYFIFLYFLMATQDIAVDGWALTMLSRDNVGYASICNAIGQSFGFFIANQGFTALSDPIWCRRFLGLRNASVISLAGFMRVGGWIFIITTIAVWFGKIEKASDSEDEPESLVETYKQVVSIFKLKSIQLLCLILFTCKVAFSPADSVAGFKLQDYGMPKADIATISPLLLMVGLVLPAFISKFVSTRPLDVFLIGVYLKLATSVLTWFVVQSAKPVYRDPKVLPGIVFFGPLVITMVLHEVAGNLMFISCMSFFSKISDPTIGGTYMTLLNTLSNLGAKWPTSMALWLLPKVHRPSWQLDGFTIETGACFLIGVLWISYFRSVTIKLQNLPHSDWMVTGKDDEQRRHL